MAPLPCTIDDGKGRYQARVVELGTWGADDEVSQPIGGMIPSWVNQPKMSTSTQCSTTFPFAMRKN